MSESVAQDQIKAFIDRIIRMRAEKADIGRDIREIYAEAKASGFDKTMLGKAVLRIEAMSTNSAGVQEQDALLDLYLSAYFGASHTHAREGDE